MRRVRTKDKPKDHENWQKRLADIEALLHGSEETTDSNRISILPTNSKSLLTQTDGPLASQQVAVARKTGSDNAGSMGMPIQQDQRGYVPSTAKASVSVVSAGGSALITNDAEPIAQTKVPSVAYEAGRLDHEPWITPMPQADVFGIGAHRNTMTPSPNDLAASIYTDQGNDSSDQTISQRQERNSVYSAESVRYMVFL